MLARRALSICGVLCAAIPILAGLALAVEPPSAAAQSPGTPVELILFRDTDSLTLLIEANGPESVSLAGLRFEVIRDGRSANHALQDFDLGLPLDALPTPLCLRLERAGSARPLPIQCAQGGVVNRTLADANIFWHDGRQAYPILLYAGDTLVGIFGTETAEYRLSYTPPIPTPGPSATPIPSEIEPPTAEILFVLDASSLMSQLLDGRTRWDAALDKLATLIERQSPLEKIGILVYGPTHSYFHPEIPLGTPDDPCDDFEWRLSYQPPLAIDLPSIGLDPAVAPGGAVALERALFAPDGADLRTNPAVTTVIILIGGLAPNDPSLGCNLTQGGLEEILYQLDQDLGKDVMLELVGISEAALPIDDTYDHVRVWSVGTEAELSDTLDLILNDAAARDSQNPGVSVLPPLDSGQQADMRLTPTPVPPQRGTPLVPLPTLSITPTAGPRPADNPTAIVPGGSAPVSPPPAQPSPTPVPPSLTPVPIASLAPSAAAPQPPVSEAACPTLQYGLVTTDGKVGANVRSDSSLAGNVLTTLPAGTVIMLCQVRDGWYFIQSPALPNGGWIRGDLLQVAADATTLFATATQYASLTPPPTPRPTDTPEPIQPTLDSGGGETGSGGESTGGGGSSLSITGIDIGSGTACSASIHVHVDGPAVSGNIHVWNAYYDANGNVYPSQTFPSGDSSHGITLGGSSEEHKTHKVWITYGNGQTSNELGGLVCNNWGQ